MEVYEQCREFKQLPGPGGLLDQDALWMDLMREVAIARHAVLGKKGNDPFGAG